PRSADNHPTPAHGSRLESRHPKPFRPGPMPHEILRVVGQVPETEGDATQVFEAAVDGFDGAVRQTGIEVGEDLVPPFPEAAAELGELAQAGGDVGVDALE